MTTTAPEAPPPAPAPEARGFTAGQISDIIRTCHECGVSQLRLGDLAVEFYQSPQLRRTESPAAVPPVGGETPLVLVDETEVADVETLPREGLSEADKAFLEDARLAQLMTDDPAAYEEEIIEALREE